MSTVNIERAVIATSLSGEKFLGVIPDAVELGQFKTDAKLGVIALDNCRSLIIQAQPNTGPDGQVIGIQSMMILLPIDLADRPIDNFSIRLASWSMPKDQGDKAKLNTQRLILQAERQEMASRAQEANIQVAGTMPQVQQR